VTNDASDALPPFFRPLWFGQGLSMVGTQVTTVAVPLTAALLLDAGPVEVGALSAATYLPWLLALPAGVWVDRLPRRRLLLAAEGLRAVALLAVPVCALLGWLSVPVLCLVVAVVGAGQVVFETAWGSVLPSLLGRSRLLAAHGRLEGTRASADVAGPSIAGGLVSLVGPPFALLLDAASYVVSIVTISRVVPDLPALAQDGPRRSWRADAADGLRFLARHRVLRAVAVEAALFNVFANATEVLLVLHAVDALDLSGGQYGLLLSVGAVGAVLGAAASGPVVRRLTLGPAYLATTGLACAALVLLPLRATPDALSVALVGTGLAVTGFGASCSSVYAATLRQSVVPDALLGRVLAAYRLVTYGSIPLAGALAAGLGATIGVRAAMVVSSLCLLTAPLPLLLSPVRGIRTVADAERMAGEPDVVAAGA
jgi:MFS family permease